MTTPAVEIAQARKLLRTGQARAIRERADVSRSEIAESLGVDESAVARWENGDRMPRGAVARRYGDLLRELAEVGE